MEVEASRVGGGGHSEKGSKSSSIQGQMEEEVEKIGVRPSNVGIEKKRVGRKRRGACPKKKKKVCLLVLEQGKVGKKKSCFKEFE
jgi:hypothetical protein